jgi:hypothetical protein
LDVDSDTDRGGCGAQGPDSDLDLDIIVGDTVHIDPEAELRRLSAAFEPLGERAAMIMPYGADEDKQAAYEVVDRAGDDGSYVYRVVLSPDPRERYCAWVHGYHQTAAYDKAMRKRAVWVEPLFGEAKDWHGLRRFRLRTLWKVNVEALLIASGQNLKRLLRRRGWARRPWPGVLPMRRMEAPIR